ncbi:MAG: alpha/beta hydrolase [Myxococcaceae bacterium]|nr:alpha/beta hydrolase [Myxococcaceae bacterium]MCI0670905.1 alpha/beta hydrolase [Myxococcaceae bacterium]
MPNFSTASGRAAFHAAYHACLARWPVPHESVFVETQAGRTHVVVSGPSDAPPVVLLHGAGLTATQWVHNVEALSRGFRVYAVETVGDFGRSEDAGALRTREESEAWLSEVLDGLGLGGVTLGGHALGAWMALGYALRNSTRVRGLVLLAPLGGILAVGSQLGLRLLSLRLLPVRRVVDGVLEWMHAPGNAPDAFAAELFRVCMWHGGPQSRLETVAFPEAELRGLRVPTLLLLGEHERACNPHKAVSRALVLLPDAEAALIPGAGHMLPSERPAEVNARVVAFLERIHSSGADARASA